MSKPLFGQVLDPDFKPTRDAVHIPIVPVIAACNLAAGEKLTLLKIGSDIAAYPWDGKNHRPIAVVDPYFATGVVKGDLFYAWLRPESTQKLWHEWTNKELDA